MAVRRDGPSGRYNQRRRKKKKQQTLLIGEIAAPFLPHTSYMEPGEASETFILVMKHMCRPVVCRDSFPEVNAQTYAEAKTSAGLQGISVYPFPENEIEVLNEDTAIATLKTLCRIRSEERALAEGLQAIVNTSCYHM